MERITRLIGSLFSVSVGTGDPENAKIEQAFKNGLSGHKPHPTRRNHFFSCQGSFESLQAEVEKAGKTARKLKNATRFKNRYVRCRNEMIIRLLCIRAEYYAFKKNNTDGFEIPDMTRERILAICNSIPDYSNKSTRKSDSQLFPDMIKRQLDGIAELKITLQLTWWHVTHEYFKFKPNPTILGKYVEYPGTLLNAGKELVQFHNMLNEIEFWCEKKKRFPRELLERIEPIMEIIESTFCKFCGKTQNLLDDEKEAVMVFKGKLRFIFDLYTWNEPYTGQDKDAEKDKIFAHTEFYKNEIKTRMDFRHKNMHFFEIKGGRIVDIEDRVTRLSQLINFVHYDFRFIEDLQPYMDRIVFKYQILFVAKPWAAVPNFETIESKAIAAYEKLIEIKLALPTLKEADGQSNMDAYSKILALLEEHQSEFDDLKMSRDGIQMEDARVDVWMD